MGKLSLAPSSADQAMTALLRVKPADLKQVEEEEGAEKAKGGKKKWPKRAMVSASQAR